MQNVDRRHSEKNNFQPELEITRSFSVRSQSALRRGARHCSWHCNRRCSLRLTARQCQTERSHDFTSVGGPAERLVPDSPMAQGVVSTSAPMNFTSSKCTVQRQALPSSCSRNLPRRRSEVSSEWATLEDHVQKNC